MTQARRILREVWAMSRGQPVTALLTVLLITGMCAAVLLTYGRTAGAERAVTATLDSPEARTIVVHASSSAGLDTSVLSRLRGLHGVTWLAAFGPATDYQNETIPGSANIPVRAGYGADLRSIGLPAHRLRHTVLAYASPQALADMNAPDAGALVDPSSGRTVNLAGLLHVPASLDSLQPLVVTPGSTARGPATVAALVVVAASPDDVKALVSAIRPLLSPLDPSQVSVQTSTSLLRLQRLIGERLNASNRGLVVMILALTAALVGVTLYSIVMMRRKDFGRRRALGASRGLIVTLLLSQTALLSLAGVVVGEGVSVIALAVAGSPLPSAAFFTAVAVLALATGVVAALIPTVVAANRDPIRELRVP